MRPDDSKPAGSAIARGAFWIILGAQWVCVPFLALMLFFGLLGFPHFSPEERQAFFLAVAYIPVLGAAGFAAVRLLRHQRYPAAIALALAPLLLILPTIAGIIAGG